MPNTSKQFNITILAPHIDDEVIGVGGSIVKHTDLGNKVNVIYVSSGENEQEIKVRENEAERVCQYLKINNFSFLREGISNPNENSLERIVALLRRYGTDFLYAPHKEEGDIEHVRIYDLAIRSRWLANNNENYYPNIPEKCDIKGILLYEVHRPIGEVHYLEDISSYAEIKKEAIRMYTSQIARVRYDESSLALNRFRGISSETSQSAEAFQLLGFCNMFNLFGGNLNGFINNHSGS